MADPIWTQDSQTSANSFVNYLGRGKEPLVGDTADNLEDIGHYTFEDVIDDTGKTLADVTLEGGDLKNQVWTQDPQS